MGLDITAYSRLKHIGKHTEDWCENEDHVNALAYDVFPLSFRGIPVIETDNFGGDRAMLIGGCYELTPDTKTAHFRAGSYSGYGRWRDDLRQQFNPDTKEGGPFYELIWFADSEGCIGPDAATDLLMDFRKHRQDYLSSHLGYDHFNEGCRESYAEWTAAFELAADAGLVEFR